MKNLPAADNLRTDSGLNHSYNEQTGISYQGNIRQHNSQVKSLLSGTITADIPEQWLREQKIDQAIHR